ncbi:MAG: nuclear transport factor 2 family protein [Hyphomonadaceae bacterium]
MRLLLLSLAAITLAACETMPTFAEAGSGPTTLYTADTASASASSAAPTYAPPPDQQLLELERQLSAAAQERGLGSAMASVLDPVDGISIRSGVTYSAADVEAGLAPPRNAGPIYWQPDRVHVSTSGDMGVTSGRYVQVISGSEAVQGRYVVVWRRDGNGDWKALTETRVADPPRSTRRR